MLVKLGGSLITNKSKPFTERKDVIERLTGEIHKAHSKGKFRLIVGHGGGSYPHRPAHKYQTHKGIINDRSLRGIAEVQDAAAKLNRIVVEALIKAGENAVSVQPSAACVAEGGKIKEWYLEPVRMMLENDIVPAPYGDVGLDTKQGCCILSTEEILVYLANNLRADRIVIATSVGGVYTADPYKYPEAELIPEISGDNFAKIRKMLSGSKDVDVTGGMLHKVERMLDLDADIMVINGDVSGNLTRAMLGRKVDGTRIGRR